MIWYSDVIWYQFRHYKKSLTDTVHCIFFPFRCPKQCLGGLGSPLMILGQSARIQGPEGWFQGWSLSQTCLCSGVVPDISSLSPLSGIVCNLELHLLPKEKAIAGFKAGKLSSIMWERFCFQAYPAVFSSCFCIVGKWPGGRAVRGVKLGSQCVALSLWLASPH